MREEIMLVEATSAQVCRQKKKPSTEAERRTLTTEKKRLLQRLFNNLV